MSMRWHYQMGRLRQPSITLGGRFVRPRPIVTLAVVGPRDTRLLDALLDTGADETVLPIWVASLIGVDLSNAPFDLATGVTSVAVPVQYAQVVLRLTDGREFREWPATVGFTTVPLNLALLGFAGCLQFFTSTFFGHIEEVELTVNPLYPGR